MSDLDTEIAAYESKQAELEREHTGQWVLVHQRDVVAFFNSFEAAATEAVNRFGRGPYLIRQIGAKPMVMPASAMYVFDSARN